MISEVELNNKLHWLFHPDSAFYFFPSRRCCEHFYSIAMFKWVWFSSQLCIYPYLYIRNFHNASIKLFQSCVVAERAENNNKYTFPSLSRSLRRMPHSPASLSGNTCINGKGMFVLLLLNGKPSWTLGCNHRKAFVDCYNSEMSIKVLSSSAFRETLTIRVPECCCWKFSFFFRFLCYLKNRRQRIENVIIWKLHAFKFSQ